ncbi:MAG: hypothetical protein RL596_2481, partial [Bacteroidota bacterium]
FTSIATLFAFVLVCGGVLLIPSRPKEEGKFHLPFVNGQYLFPIIVVAAFAIVNYFDNHYITNLLNTATANSISTIIFWLVCFALSVITYLKKYSLVPLLGLTTCMYLLTGMTAMNWAWFGGWLGLGLVIYFAYGKTNSKLANN